MTHSTDGVSDAERDLLRKSVRDFLADGWPAEGAVERAGDVDAIAKLWRGMARQGLAALGCDAAEGGLREIVLVFEELGRAACPAPLPGAIAANLTLAAAESRAASSAFDALHRGDAIAALALGAFDGDLAAGRVTVQGNTVRGQLSFVEDIQAATHVIVFTDAPAGVALVARDAEGLAIQPTPGLAVPPLARLTLENVRALWLEVPDATLAHTALAVRLACCGRALGAAQRAFDLSVEHAKVRKQFGQFIGQFQAVQHKLADNLIRLDGARLAIETAAAAHDAGNPDWHVFASSALAFAGPALRTVSIETHRALGAIGYAEEHEAPRHFRRVHADLARFGGVSRARAELADVLLGPVH